VGAIVDIALGFLILLAAVRNRHLAPPTPFAGSLERPVARLAALTLATVLFIAMVATLFDFDRTRLTSGVYRYAVLPRSGDYTVPFYRDGRTATVSIRRS